MTYTKSAPVCPPSQLCKRQFRPVSQVSYGTNHLTDIHNGFSGFFFVPNKAIHPRAHNAQTPILNLARSGDCPQDNTLANAGTTP